MLATIELGNAIYALVLASSFDGLGACVGSLFQGMMAVFKHASPAILIPTANNGRYEKGMRINVKELVGCISLSCRKPNEN